jgi:hypothetical protein
MKTKKPKTRGPSDKELRGFASWCANNRGTMKDSIYDWARFGRCVENKAQALFRPKCVECGK